MGYRLLYYRRGRLVARAMATAFACITHSFNQEPSSLARDAPLVKIEQKKKSSIGSLDTM